MLQCSEWLTHSAVSDAEHRAHAVEAADERTPPLLLLPVPVPVPETVRLDPAASGAHHEQRPAAAAHKPGLLLRRHDALRRERVAVIDVNHFCGADCALHACGSRKSGVNIDVSHDTVLKVGVV